MIPQIYHSEELRLRRIITRSIKLSTVSKHLNFFNRKAPFDAGNNKLNAYQIGYSDQTVYKYAFFQFSVSTLSQTQCTRGGEWLSLLISCDLHRGFQVPPPNLRQHMCHHAPAWSRRDHRKKLRNRGRQDALQIRRSSWESSWRSSSFLGRRM